MANYQIAYNHTTKEVRIQTAGDAIPNGFNNIGTFEHADVENAITDLEFDVNHVFFHHVREALYHTSSRTGLAAPGSLQFPENITDMAGIEITLDTTPTAVLTNTVAPAVTGTAQVGQTLTLSNGTWTPTGSTYTRKWQVADTGAGPWTDIAGATATTYQPVAGQVGKVIRGVVTATNASVEQTKTANSNATAAVVAA